MGFLTGKTAIITGAGFATLSDGRCGSIGYGIATAYAKEGANLVITGRNVAKLEKAKEELEVARAENKKLPKFKEQIYRADVDTNHFYIPENLKDVAEKRFNKKGSGWVSMIIAIIVLTAVFIALLFVLPLLFDFIA